MEAQTNAEKTTTLFGGRLVTIQREDGSNEEIRVRQVPLAEYEKAFGFIGDELALVAFICGKEKAWLLGSTEIGSGVSADSYEALQGAAQEVNARGFFAYVARRHQKELRAQEQMILMVAKLPADTLKLAAEMGGAGTLPTSLRNLPSRQS